MGFLLLTRADQEPRHRLAAACGLRPFIYIFCLRPATLRPAAFIYIYARSSRSRSGAPGRSGPSYSQFSLTCNRGILQSQSATSKPHALTSSRRFRSITNTCSRNDSSGSRFTRDFRSAQVNECCIIFSSCFGVMGAEAPVLVRLAERIARPIQARHRRVCSLI